MDRLPPKTAAEMAKDIYLVQQGGSVKAFLSRPEFSKNKNNKQHLKANVGLRTLYVSDAFGLCAVGGGEYENDVFLIFRGSTFANDNADWFSNARIGVEFSSTGLPVHIGFNQIFKSMKIEIDDFLSSNKVTGTIHCVGHSLGGAVATIVADWVSKYFANDVRLYTFGAPRPGLMAFAWSLSNRMNKNNIYRTFHSTDPVPMVPLFPFTQPPLPGYGHCIPSTEAITSFEAHDKGKYVNSVRNYTWEQLEMRKPPYSVESVIEQWLESKFPVNPADPKVWQMMNSALIYVIKKAGGALAVTLQAGVSGVVTLADKLAWVLQQGINLYEQHRGLIVSLMKKIAQLLSITVLKTDAEITQLYMRDMLMRLMNRMNQDAQRAMRGY